MYERSPEQAPQGLTADGRCPECGGVLAHVSGCESCVSCGLSRCHG